MNQNLNHGKWLVIINPNAGNGKGKKDFDRITGLLGREEIPFSVRITGKKTEATDHARDAIENGFRKIIVVGGDGTMNEVINGVFSQNTCLPVEIIVALIPVGTGNDWGRMFGIPLLYEGAIKVIKENRMMLHDIGFITYYTGNRQMKRYFINIAGLGFEAMVVSRTNKQKEKGRSNAAIYFYNLLVSLISYRKETAVIEIDGRKSTTRVFSINVGNGRYCGGGMRQTPHAVPDDGMLDITVIKNMGRIEIIRSLKLLYDGTILSHPKVDGYRSTNLKVSSDALLYAEADGESLGHTPVEFGIIPSAINIIYGTNIIQ